MSKAHNYIDMTGKVIGHWTVLNQAKISGRAMYWNCRCVCGKEKAVRGQCLRSGRSLSCGCKRSGMNPQPWCLDPPVAYLVLKGVRWVVDASDLDRVSSTRWFYSKKYIYTVIDNNKIYMHTYITRLDYVDHINMDTRDNRRCNLRLATQSQNLCNVGRKVTNTSGYKGVSLHKASGRWQATIVKNRRQHHLGLYDTAREAALAYDRAALQLHGEFARTNDMLGLL